MSERYVCVHGHFYQPPRENPWLEAIEVQDSAYPYHDWNERISTECYGPNGQSRLLDGYGNIRAILNNYARISYNFGPTLLSWMKESAPGVYQKVIDADVESRERFSGHGSAMAQAYNHMIMPLSNTRDKRTQIVWGLRDFEQHFGRPAEGMWLPETAVDLETLDLMVQSGIKFTVLSPHQAGAIRPLAARQAEWQDVRGSRLDPTRAYACSLNDDHVISIFFYDGTISQALAFEGLLSDGKNFENRILGAFRDDRAWPQIVHIATDGESYGHHFRGGDMALAFALEDIAQNGSAKLINYGAYLEAQPPAWEVQIVENSSWSCIHGIERWRSDCGCNTGGHPTWNQAWRAPLRESLDWLRDQLAPLYEEAAAAYFRDPWMARDEYIEVINDRSPKVIDGFLGHVSGKPIDAEGRQRILELLELQRHALLMFTSCGWFFDELSGIETTQVLQYAARAVQLAAKLFDRDLEPEFLDRLQPARSNLPENGDGRAVYEKFVRPAKIDLPNVAAHAAMSAVFEPREQLSRIASFEVDIRDQDLLEVGSLRLRLGHAVVTSRVTRATADLSSVVLDLGAQNLTCKIKPFDERAYEDEQQRLKQTFTTADLADVLRVMDDLFGDTSYTLRSAFKDEQRKILGFITSAALDDAESLSRALYERHAPLMLFLASAQVPMPAALRAAAQLALNADLLQALQQPSVDLDRVRWLLEVIGKTGVTIDEVGLGFAFGKNLQTMARDLAAKPKDSDLIERLAAAASLLPHLPFEVNLWQTQNDFYQVLEDTLPVMRVQAVGGNRRAADWLTQFGAAAQSLHISVPEEVPKEERHAA